MDKALMGDKVKLAEGQEDPQGVAGLTGVAQKLVYKKGAGLLLLVAFDAGDDGLKLAEIKPEALEVIERAPHYMGRQVYLATGAPDPHGVRGRPGVVTDPARPGPKGKGVYVRVTFQGAEPVTVDLPHDHVVGTA